MSLSEFIESLFSLLGNRFYDRDQSFLFFKRYDADCDGNISYREWSSIITPSDSILANLLLSRSPHEGRISYET